jgi:hypothetical protein
LKEGKEILSQIALLAEECGFQLLILGFMILGLIWGVCEFRAILGFLGVGSFSQFFEKMKVAVT